MLLLLLLGIAAALPPSASSPAEGAGGGTIPARPNPVPPPASGIYACAHPDFGPRDDRVSAEAVRDFEAKAGRRIVWAYFSWHWDRGILFPARSCRVLRDCGVIPLVGILPWSRPWADPPGPERTYSLRRIAGGRFDGPIRAAARSARDLGFPLMMEFGPETDGSWFPWNGAWNGRGGTKGYGDPRIPDGPEVYRAAFRRIVRLFRAEGAANVAWVFHLAAEPVPKEPWNAPAAYYPGDDAVDWIGVSLYGRLRPGSAVPLSVLLDRAYPALAALSPRKPLAVLEWGLSEDPERGEKPDWVRSGFASLASGRWPRVRALAWWNKPLRPDGSRSGLEIDSSPESLAAYREGLADPRYDARPSGAP